MPLPPSDVEGAKRRIAEYLTPPAPPQDDCWGSGFIGLVDYYLYEGSDVRDLLHDFAIALADGLAVRHPEVTAEIAGTDVIISDGHLPGTVRKVYLNITHRIDEEWHKPSPNADMLAARIEDDLLQQLTPPCR